MTRRRPALAARTALTLALAASALLAGAPARAQMFKDAELQRLFADRSVPLRQRDAQLLRRAQERLAGDPTDTQALLGLALGHVSQRDAARREEALARLDECTARQPQAAACHYGHAVLLGSHAIQVGLLKAMGSAGRIRDGFARALELEPLWYPARAGLVQFYTQAPAVAGGSLRKAREVAQAAAAQRPEQARVLTAMIALTDKDYDAAQAALTGLRRGTDPEVDEDADGSWIAMGASLVSAGQLDRARSVFDAVARERPDSAYGPYGLGRVAAEQARHEDAVRLYQQAAVRRDADRVPVDYRLGLSLAALNQRDAARAALQRFLDRPGSWPSSQLDDARKRLKDLSS